MNEITNVRITKETIKTIAKLLYDRFSFFNEKYNYYLSIKDNDEVINGTKQEVLVTTSPKLEFEVTIKGQTETKSDIDWFLDNLYNKSASIEKVGINYLSYYAQDGNYQFFYSLPRCEEYVTLSFREDSIYYTVENKDALSDYDTLISQINALIYNAPVKCDKTITGKFMRENIPSISNGLILGIIFSIIMIALANLNVFSKSFSEIINGDLFIIVSFVIFILVGFVIPGKNHSLYRKLPIKRKYVGYNYSKNKSVFSDDIKRTAEDCEIEIGANTNNSKVREKIEKNYANAKIYVLIEVVLYVALYFIKNFII